MTGNHVSMALTLNDFSWLAGLDSDYHGIIHSGQARKSRGHSYRIESKTKSMTEDSMTMDLPDGDVEKM
jgi:hypothetical protein